MAFLIILRGWHESATASVLTETISAHILADYIRYILIFPSHLHLDIGVFILFGFQTKMVYVLSDEWYTCMPLSISCS
jgi:hypothetical protein